MKLVLENRSNVRINLKQTRTKALKIIRKLKIKWDVGIFFVSKITIRNLNKKYRRKNKPTDVLSFEMNEDKYLGDIIISPDVAKVNAKKYEHKFSDEIGRLIIHGLLHLQGYDHKIRKQADKMFKIQDKLHEEVW